MEWLKVVLLGFIEGITEFLPISSTGHLIVASAALDFSSRLQDTFVVFIQIGAVVAVLIYYAADIWQQVRHVSHDKQTQQFWLSIVIAFIPAAILGFLFGDKIDEVLFKPAVVALALIAGGIAFIVVEQLPRFKQQEDVAPTTKITPKQALIVGVCQILALIPGMSRSGMSILGGMFAGLNRATATQFSFYLAIPTLGIATLYQLLKNLDQISSQDLLYLIVGAVIAGIIAWLSIALLLRYVARNSFVLFGIYRILAGIVILLLVAAGTL